MDDLAQDTPVVVALSRSGLLVADALAESLSAPLHRWGSSSLNILGRVVIVVDDGLIAAPPVCDLLRLMRARSPNRLVFAAPIAVRDALSRVRDVADAAVTLQLETELGSVADRYVRYRPIDEPEAVAIIERARERLGACPTRRTRTFSSIPPA